MSERTRVPDVFRDDRDPPTDPPAGDDDDGHGGDQCIACGRDLDVEVGGEPCAHHDGACCQCAYHLPEALLASAADSGDFTIGLRDGSRVHYETARVTGLYAHLVGIKAWSLHPVGMARLPAAIDVRLADVVWAVDHAQEGPR